MRRETGRERQREKEEEVLRGFVFQGFLSP
jgi:hypothetical protein